MFACVCVCVCLRDVATTAEARAHARMHAAACDEKLVIASMYLYGDLNNKHI